jgi:sugar/nucleoside kinase (ribokinase family)
MVSPPDNARWDVIGVGANSVDYVYRLPAAPALDGPDAKIRIGTRSVSCGGQVTTALCTAAAMGLGAKYVGTMGSDRNADRMRAELTRRGIDISDIAVRQTPNPYAVILVVEPTGERIVLWDRPDGLQLRAQDVPADALRETRLLHVDDVDEEASIQAARIARDAGAHVTSDIERVTSRTWELVEAVSLPVFAEHAPAALTGQPDIDRALRAIRGRHPGLICVTLGRRGAILLEGERLHHAPGFDIEAVDTTGAGDVFRGALIYSLLRSDSPSDMLRFANAAAALSCTRPGAISSVPTVDETRAFLARASS